MPRMEQIETQILFIRNFPRDIEKDTIMELFSQYGAIIQIRIGTNDSTAGTGFVVYKRVEDARNAIKHMNGYYLDKMYLNISYWQPFDKFRLMMGQK